MLRAVAATRFGNTKTMKPLGLEPGVDTNDRLHEDHSPHGEGLLTAPKRTTRFSPAPDIPS
jgi:hypothetical protein